MLNKEFEAYKIKREIKRSGNVYEFIRSVLNAFQEPTNDTQSVCTIKGLYHEENSTIQVSTGETTQYRTKKVPMILVPYECTTSLKVGDYTMLNGKKLVVSGVTNIQEWNIIGDVSLEVVDVGVDANVSNV